MSRKPLSNLSYSDRIIYRSNVEIATKLYDEILRKVPGAIVELTPGADGRKIRYFDLL